ncbi:uncharacterized protein LOC135717189 [Ochlerotatus camptorhynchus]|uniref:uncharacterized protein LOC135717189 n=1 Tax=Ochlerotatus camptorhynchus TaxID=644619 RepID=UPI0031E05223
MKIAYDRQTGVLQLSQEAHVARVLELFVLAECNPAKSPMEKGLQLQREGTLTAEPYRELIDSLMYIMLCVRPDICFLVGYLGRYQQKPTETHWQCLKRIVRYLKGSANAEDLVILNDGGPTFFNGRHTTAIDVSTASRSLAGKVLWSIKPDLCGSDHYPVQIRLSTTSPPENTRRPRWRYGEADWEGFQHTYRALSQNQEPSNIPRITEIIYKAVYPKLAVSPGGRHSAGGTSPNDPAREEVLANYRQQHNKCRQEIRTAKQNCWSDFLESINAEQSSAELWSRINALSSKRRSSPIQTHRTDTVTITDPTVVADELGKYFAKLSGISEYSESFRQQRRSTDQQLVFALSRSNGNSAGPDEIGYTMLKQLPPEGKTKLLDLYNQLWTAEEYPENWRESLVIPLPKTNVGTKDITRFRSIALTCFMAKVLERMVNRRLKQYLEANGLLDHRQHAFRQRDGTSTYFATLGEVLKEAKDQGHHAEIVSLDISKAFNRTWTPAGLKKLADWGLKGHILYFVRNFLTDRSFRVSVGNVKSGSFSEETGVPHGSVIAVTLFLVAMNGVFDQLPKNVYIFVRTKLRAQAAVSSVVRLGIQLSAGKSVRCHIFTTRHRNNGQPIMIKKQAIPAKNTQVKKDCRSRSNLIKTISHPHRSNNHEIRFHVARAIIDSRLLYDVEITCLAAKKAVQILEPVYNGYVRTVSGPLPSTLADDACVEAGILPFRLVFTAATTTKATAFLAKTSGNNRIVLLDEANRLHGDKSWQSH